MAPTPVSASDVSQKCKRVINFSAGPSKLPESVLQRAQEEMLNFKDTGCSVMELSHRGQAFVSVMTEAERLTRQLLSVPDNFRVLFMQGGGCGQFAAVPMNLAGRRGGSGPVADYIVSGKWSAAAAAEAERYCRVRRLEEAAATEEGGRLWDFSEDAAFVYMCDNETVDGVEFSEPPQTPAGVPLVADMSSNLMSRPVDFSRYGLIFAGAQKNLGPAGVTLVIVRDDLMDCALPYCPSILNYQVTSRNASLYNTPPTYSIYVTGLVMQWVRDAGGIRRMEELAAEKSSLIYNFIDNSNGFYYCPVEKCSRSRMNVVFRIAGGNEALEKRFADEATKQGLTNLEGHRSVGGLRASLYNAVTLAETRALANFMRDFVAIAGRAAVTADTTEPLLA